MLTKRAHFIQGRQRKQKEDIETSTRDDDDNDDGEGEGDGDTMSRMASTKLGSWRCCAQHVPETHHPDGRTSA